MENDFFADYARVRIACFVVYTHGAGHACMQLHAMKRKWLDVKLEGDAVCGKGIK